MVVVVPGTCPAVVVVLGFDVTLVVVLGVLARGRPVGTSNPPNLPPDDAVVGVVGEGVTVCTDVEVGGGWTSRYSTPRPPKATARATVDHRARKRRRNSGPARGCRAEQSSRRGDTCFAEGQDHTAPDLHAHDRLAPGRRADHEP